MSVEDGYAYPSSAPEESESSVSVVDESELSVSVVDESESSALVSDGLLLLFLPG